MRAFSTVLALVAGFVAAAPGFALERIYLVRHAEKQEPWPAGYEVYQPLDARGRARAAALVDRLAEVGIAGVYASDTTRAFATGVPTALAFGVAIEADRATVDAEALPAFLARLRERHAADRAVLVVGHSNTIARVLAALGAEPACHAALGVRADGFIEGYDGLWVVDLARPGCAGMSRQEQTVPAPGSDSAEPAAERP